MPKPATKPLARSYTPLKLEVQRAAKELVVDDFVDTYFRERPKTIPELRLDDEPAIPTPPAPPSEPDRPRSPADEESGIRALGQIHRDEAIELSIAEHEEDIVALEAQLADRDEHIESMQGEMLRLKMELEALRLQRSAPAEPAAPIVVRRIIDVDSRPPTAVAPVAPLAPVADAPAASVGAAEPISLPPSAVVGAAMAGRRRGAAWVMLATASVIVVVGGFAALFLGKKTPAAASASSPAVAVEPSTAKASPRSPEPAPEPSTAPLPSTAAPASSAPPSPGGAPVLAGASDVEEAGLLSFQAHLTVVSSIDAEVVVQGQPVGRTNEKILVRCGPRNVRLQDERGWRSAGQHVPITCMHAVTVPIEPTP